MRFHFGVSFRPTKILKYIGLVFLGLLAFFGISNVNAAEISVDEISAGDGTNNSIYCNSNFSNWCPNPYFDLQPPYTDYAPIKYINFDFADSLSANHDYTFDIVFEVARPVSLNDFEQESFTFWSYSGVQLNDTTIIWNQQNTYEYQTGIYTSTFHYRGQFTPSSSSNGFYTRLTLEQNESVYGIIVLSVQLVDNDSGDALINANYENTQNIINNANNNTNNIINNQDSNTQQIIDNQNQNANMINDNLQSCRESYNLFNYENIDFSQKYQVNASISNNVVSSTTTGGASPWFFVLFPNIYVSSGMQYTLSFNYTGDLIKPRVFAVGNLGYYEFSGNVSNGRFVGTITIPNNVTAIRLMFYQAENSSITISNIMFERGLLAHPYEDYGIQVCSSKLDSLNYSIDNTNQSIQDLNDTISDDTIDTSTSNDFFDNFEDNHHGLSGIVSLPLTTIQSLNNASCTPLTLSIPYLQSNNSLQLPCLTPIYQQNFGTFFTLYQSIIFGFVSYYVCVSIFYMVKDFKDPNKDKIEVMDL